MKSFLKRCVKSFHKGLGTRPKAEQQTFRPGMERLEDRQLFAANLTASFERTNGLGVLHIEGTDKADQIVVRQANNLISVDGALVNGSYRYVSASAVQVIDVKGLGGDDHIRLNSEIGYGPQPIKAISIVDAGAGNDRVFGAAGSNFLNGGAGNDELWGNNAPDIIAGGTGIDRLYGMDGDDRLDGGEQSDLLRGGNGLDILQGGGGIDILVGDAGNDFLFYDVRDSDLGITHEETGRKILNATQAQLEDAARTQLANIRLLNTMNQVQLAFVQLMSTSNEQQFLNNINRVYADVLDGAFRYQGQSIFGLVGGGLTKLPLSPFNPGPGGAGYAPPNYTVS